MTTACLVGTYERNHSANRLLRLALEAGGWHVHEVHSALWEETRQKGAAYFAPRSLLGLGFRWLRVQRRLRQDWRVQVRAMDSPPLVIMGFGGQLDVLGAGAFQPRYGLLFAPLVSLSETLVEDRQVMAAGGLGARALRALDRATLRRAEMVLADTATHARYLVALGAPAERVAVWYLGVEPEFLSPPEVAVIPKRVLFYGSYVPLHGVETIVEAAVRLQGQAQFRLIGRGPERARVEERARVAGVEIEFVDPVPLAALPAELGRAAVVLGIFGAGQKAEMVIPNKVYQAAALGRPLVTRDSPALREIFTPDEHCVAVRAADADALAGAITRLLETPERGHGLGAAARQLMLTRFSLARQGACLTQLLQERLGAIAPAARGAEA